MKRSPESSRKCHQSVLCVPRESSQVAKFIKMTAALASSPMLPVCEYLARYLKAVQDTLIKLNNEQAADLRPRGLQLASGLVKFFVEQRHPPGPDYRKE